MSYNTTQRKAVINFLSDNENKQFTIEEIVTELDKTCSAPGKSSVYRIVAALVENGIVKRFANGKRFLYQIIRCEEHAPHIHLKCTVCGKIFHLDKNISDTLNSLIKTTANFNVSDEQTVIFGVCSECK